MTNCAQNMTETPVFQLA